MHSHLLLLVALFLLHVTQSSARPLPDQHRITREAKEVKNSEKAQKLNPQGKEEYEPSLKEENKKDEVDSDFMLFQGDIIVTLNEWKQMTNSLSHEQEDDDHDAPLGDDRNKRSMGSGMNVPMQELAPLDRKDAADSKATVSRVWPNCEVPYKFDQRLSSEMREKFMMAMILWEDSTCINFIRAQPHHTDYLLFIKADICSSHVGRRGGGYQEVTLADDCSQVGHAAHELGHAIGLWHEHSRLDRDDYIEIHKENIEYKWDYVNFDIISRNTYDEVPDVGYDIQSIMHYSPFAFAANHTPGGETITLREDADLPELGCINTLEMGQRKTLSYKDKKRASGLYGCDFTEVEEECITPTTTLPVETTEPITTMMPTPTTTITEQPKPTKLNSGDILAFTFGDGGHGLRCVPSPGCTPVACFDHGGSTCHAPDYQFHIINHPSSSVKQKNDRIKSSNTVLLRSVNTPTRWLDCSDATRCVISPCTEDNPDDPANSSYISNCSRHQFQVFGVGRPDNRVLNENHKLKFKYNNSVDGYLNCNGKRCRLLQEGSCPALKGLKVPFARNKEGLCDIQSFEVDLLSTI